PTGANHQGMKLTLSLLFATATLFAGTPPESTGDQILLYPAIARITADGCEVRWHGLVFEPEGRALFRVLMRRALGIDDEKLTPAEKATFKVRAGYFLVDDERDKKLLLTVRGESIPLGSSAANGHFQASSTTKSNIWIDSGFAGGDTNLVLLGQAAIRGGVTRSVAVHLTFLGDTGVSVVSDIDDTIKVSEVRDRHALVMNTFCRPFRAVGGMSELYERWSRCGAQFHYVTASPWQLYPPLWEFIRSNGFPSGTFHMKSFRFK